MIVSSTLGCINNNDVRLVLDALLNVLHLIFAAIGNAFAVLSDAPKRKRYDEYGTEGTELRRRSQPNGYEYDFTRGGFEGKYFFCVLEMSMA